MTAGAYYPYLSGRLQGFLKSLAFELEMKKIVDSETAEKIKEYVEASLKEAEQAAKDYAQQY